MANNKNITFNQLEASMTKVKAAIDKKANTNHGTHVPTTGTANNATYLRNDNQWHKIVPSDIGAAPISHGDHVTYSKTSPSAPGTASAGSAANVSRGDHVHPLQTNVSGSSGSCTGNAATATKLKTARNIALTGTITGNANFDGSGNISIATSVGSTPASGGNWFKGIPTVTSAGVMEIGKYIDFHNAADSTTDYDVRLQCNGTSANTVNMPTNSGTLALLSDNVASATRLQYARKLTIGNTGKTFNGTADVAWTLAEIGAAASNHTHSYIPLSGSSSITGNLEFSNSGTSTRGIIGAAGDNDYWRIVGGATASNAAYLEIATADDASEPIYVRQYGSGKFGTLTRTATLLDGSGNTSFPGTVTAPTFAGALNGNASTATKLQTARKINDIAFDGTADKTIPLKTFGSYVGDDNTKNYHRILSSGNVTSQWTDKVITLMASGDFDGGAYGIVRIILRTNSSTANSNGKIEWITRKGFGLDSIVFNIKNTAGATIMDVFYKCPGTYNCVTWTVLGEGVRDGRNGGNGGYGGTWTKYNTAAGSTETYTADTMKTIASYTSTMNKGTDAAFVYASSTSDKLTTARTINGTSFNGTANITTANWGTARTLTVGNTGKSVNGGGNISWSIDEIGALKASKQGATDVNTLKTTGRYFIKGTPTNAPTTNNGVIDVAWDLGTPYQIFYPDNANTAYKRNWNNSNSTWSSWTQLKFTDTNTWRGVQNNLTSDATDQSLSAAQGKVLKGLVDGKAASNHTHSNYAASSHGHNYLSVKGNNTINSTANDTTAKWGEQNNSVHWYTEAGKLKDQPSQWGYLINIGKSSEVHQIWMAQAGGDLSHRGGNSSGWNGSWKTILDSTNYSTWAAAKSHTHTNLTTKTVSSGTLTLGTELYQYAAISSNTTIKLPNVSSFTEIHLFFNWPTNVSVTMPSGVKWQQGVMYGPGHVHEFVFTYVNNIGWLGGCVVYG